MANKKTNKIELAPPAFTFMPYYIDQDRGWSGLYESFSNIDQYKKPDRIKSLYYHLGIYTRSTVELMVPNVDILLMRKYTALFVQIIIFKTKIICINRLNK